MQRSQKEEKGTPSVIPQDKMPAKEEDATIEADKDAKKHGGEKTIYKPFAEFPFEVLTEVLKNLDLKDVWSARLVCRGFRDCAWPAFGAALSETLFDLKSVGSWENLKAISEKEYLAKHVRELYFGCSYFRATVDNRALFAEVAIPFVNLQRDEEFWEAIDDNALPFPDLWKEYNPDQVQMAQLAIKRLASIFSRLDHILSIDYVQYLKPKARRDLEMSIYGTVVYPTITNNRWYRRPYEFTDETALCVILAAVQRSRVIPRRLPTTDLVPQIATLGWMEWSEELSEEEMWDKVTQGGRYWWSAP